MSAYAPGYYRSTGDQFAPLLVVGLIVALALAGLLVMAGATIAVVALAGLVLVCAVLVRPALAVYAVTLAMVFGDFHISDQNQAAGSLMFESLAKYGINFTPAEVLLICGLIGLLLRLTFDPSLHFRAGTLFTPVMLLVAAVLLACVVGISRGADMQTLRQEVRGLFYVPVLYLLVTHFFARRDRFLYLMSVFVIAVNIASVESIYRYYAHVRTYDLSLSQSLAFAHENSLLCAAAIILILARFVWAKHPLREWKYLLLVPVPLVAMLVMHRRAGLVALDGGVALLCLVLLRQKMHTFLIFVPMALLAFGMVVAVTWNNPGSSGELARAVQSVTNSNQLSARDQSSDLYRAREEMNIRMNIEAAPILGKGFGRPYTFYVSVTDLSADWPLWDSVPHNSVLWFWLDAGIVGFIALTLLFAAAMMRSMQLLTTLPNSLKPYAFAMGAIVFMFFMYSWVDLGLITPRTLALFALALGGIAILSERDLNLPSPAADAEAE